MVYDAYLVEELHNIFPEAFKASREYIKYEYVNTEWGVEKVAVSVGTERLAECILSTAQAFSRGGSCKERAISYLQTFRKKSVQKQELKKFKIQK